VRRLHIIYYRETEHPTALLLPSLLTTFKKRHFTSYTTTRSTDIWPNREELLQYELALEVEQLLLEILYPPPEKNGRRATKTPARTRDQFTTPVTPRKKGAAPTPLKTPASTSKSNVSLATPKNPTDDYLPIWADENLEEDPEPEVKKETKIKEYLEKWLFPKWKQHLAVRTAEDLNELADRSPGLARFETGKRHKTPLIHSLINGDKATCILEWYPKRSQLLGR
jgi:Fanconi-associated nuclease 1